MKVGDLVVMKFAMFWTAKMNKHITYTNRPGLVVEVCHNAIRVLCHDGQVKRDLSEHYEVISESR